MNPTSHTACMYLLKTERPPWRIIDFPFHFLSVSRIMKFVEFIINLFVYLLVGDKNTCHILSPPSLYLDLWSSWDLLLVSHEHAPWPLWCHYVVAHGPLGYIHTYHCNSRIPCQNSIAIVIPSNKYGMTRITSIDVGFSCWCTFFLTNYTAMVNR